LKERAFHSFYRNGGLFGDTAADEENPFGGIHNGKAAPDRLGRQASIVWIVYSVFTSKRILAERDDLLGIGPGLNDGRLNALVQIQCSR
jgi:hypothetical protein